MSKADTSDSLVRLNKRIADSGLCSRRHADVLIQAGKVKVNGKVVTELGAKVHPVTDVIHVEGAPLPHVRLQYLVLHKPRGVITTRSDERGRKTIYDLLPEQALSVDPAGRLDRDSAGLLILSNDGDFIHQVTHPGFHLPKTYHVTTRRLLSSDDVKRLMDGIELLPEGKVAKMESLEVLGPKSYRVVLLTGLNRQIRRSFEALGNEVESLKRVAIGQVRLGRLKPGQFRPLRSWEIQALLASAAASSRPKKTAKKPRK